MLIPTTFAFRGVIGGTFDTIVTLYDTRPEYVYYGQWLPTDTYPQYAVTVGSDGNAYVCEAAASTGQDPTENATVWTALTPMNVTGWTATFQCNGATPDFTLTVGSGITLGNTLGTIAISATAEDTSTFTPGCYPYYLKTVDTSSNTYYPLRGTIDFENPLPTVYTDCC